MSPWRLVVCLTLLLPGLGFAQTPDEWTPYTPPAEETVPPPPLVPAPPLPQPPPPPPAPSRPPPTAQAPKEEVPEGEIIPRDPVAQRADSAQTAMRIIITPWSGAITGMMGVIIGSIPTAIVALPFCLGSRDFEDEPQCAIAVGTGLSVTYTVGVTLGVTFVGKLIGGQGDGVMTFLAALAGAAAGSGIGIATRSTGALILGMAVGPILCAVAGYEISHSLFMQSAGPGFQARSGFRVMPMAGITPGGGILGGLVGRF
jgi:hypothetical protein